ncbi:protein angel [Anastrepha ludens]|uniref:protein angel n=1 Tax=Anastrepha ludens TaxID=28586 RepID=UPI0023B1A641|nr:protein angel [Anastrepha ludens]
MFKTLITCIHTNNLLSSVKSLGSHVEQLKAYTRSRWQRTKKMRRTWERVIGAGDRKEYTLLSYNILAQDLLVEHLHLYIDIEPPMLRWDHRLLRLTEEIQYIKPDILCLQEMQFNHIKGFIRRISFKRELEYVFKKKTGCRTDGCAIIYDKSKFRLLAEHPVEYYTRGHAVLNRDNIALLAKFADKKQPKKKFVIATTHLLYNPKRQDVRIAQVQSLLEAIHEFSVETEGGKNKPLPVILTGDFNFESKTRPYQVLSEPFKSDSVSEKPVSDSAKNCSKQEANREYYLRAAGGEESVNNLQMAPIDFGNQSASTFQQNWITVDYVLHSVDQYRNKIQVQSVYALPKINDCIQHGQIPNKFLGSDHYSLAIKFSVL